MKKGMRGMREGMKEGNDEARQTEGDNGQGGQETVNEGGEGETRR